jgi:hypothetical protein
MRLLHVYVRSGLPLDTETCSDYAAVMGRTGTTEDLRRLLAWMREINATSKWLPMNLKHFVEGANVCCESADKLCVCVCVCVCV